MKDTGRENSIGLAYYQSVIEMLQIAGTTTGDYRHRYCFTDSTGQFQIISSPLAISIPTGKEQFPSTESHSLLSPFDGINASGLSPSVGTDLPFNTGTVFYLLSINSHDNTLTAKFLRPFGNKLRILHGGGINGHLVCPCFYHAPHVSNATQ